MLKTITKNIANLYYNWAISLFVSFFKKDKRVRNIILNGSVASGQFRYFKSDIDVSIVLHDDNKKEDFKKSYKIKLYLIFPLCPWFLPLSERLQNVFTHAELVANTPSQYRGYLKNSTYKILYGAPIQLGTNPLDDIHYFEDRIYQYINAPSIESSRTHSLEDKCTISSTAKIEEEVLENINFLKDSNGNFMNLPHLGAYKNRIFNWKSLDELILSSNSFSKQHRFVRSIHYSNPWIVFSFDGIKVIHQDRLHPALIGQTTEYNSDLSFYRELDQAFVDEHTRDFIKYKQSYRNDYLNRPMILNLASYLNLYNNNEVGINTDLAMAINIILRHPYNKAKVSLCICTKNRVDSLIELLRSVQNQTCLPDEILIVNNGNEWSDDLKEDLKSIVQTETNLIESKLTTISALRNLCISKAKHEIISFVDDDCVLTRDWVDRVSSHFSSDPHLDLLGGSVTHYKRNEFDTNEAFHRSYQEVIENVN